MLDCNLIGAYIINTNLAYTILRKMLQFFPRKAARDCWKIKWPKKQNLFAFILNAIKKLLILMSNVNVFSNVQQNC